VQNFEICYSLENTTAKLHMVQVFKNPRRPK